ncbi:MAG: cell division protein FtsL [Firmicutes bacterium]|nr:cell division protein FtsL [Bacillota bacterium]
MLVAKKSSHAWQQSQFQPELKTNTGKQPQVITVTQKLKVLATVLVCSVMAITVVAHAVKMVEVTRQVESARAELQALQEEAQHLKLEIATLRTPERLEQKAYELGMQYPRRDQLIILSYDATGD